MDYEAYRKAYFVDPAPKARYEFGEPFGFTLFFQEYEEAVAFYSAVFGPPAYVEGDSTRGWKLGAIWLTLLRASQDNPTGAE